MIENYASIFEVSVFALLLSSKLPCFISLALEVYQYIIRRSARLPQNVTVCWPSRA